MTKKFAHVTRFVNSKAGGHGSPFYWDDDRMSPEQKRKAEMLAKIKANLGKSKNG